MNFLNSDKKIKLSLLFFFLFFSFIPFSVFAFDTCGRYTTQWCLNSPVSFDSSGASVCDLSLDGENITEILDGQLVTPGNCDEGKYNLTMTGYSFCIDSQYVEFSNDFCPDEPLPEYEANANIPLATNLFSDVILFIRELLPAISGIFGIVVATYFAKRAFSIFY